MKALVTGAGGFIGSHLVEHLVDEGDDVVALVHYRGDGGFGHLAAPAPIVDVVAGDVRDADAMMALVERRRPHVIYNLAALISIPHSYDSPEAFLETNAGGCLHLLNACRRYGIRLVQMSTSETYGTARTRSMDESHPLNAQSPYAASKTAADQLCIAFSRSYGVDVRIARPFNTFGPRQSQRSVIPNVVAQILRGETEIRVGALDATRDFTYVTDTVRALRLLGITTSIEQGDVLGPWNIASGKETSIEGLVHMAGTMLRRRVAAVLDDEYRRPETSEVRRLCGDASAIRRLCGWAPAIPLPDGIKKVAEWMRPRLDGIREGRVT